HPINRRQPHRPSPWDAPAPPSRSLRRVLAGAAGEDALEAADLGGDLFELGAGEDEAWVEEPADVGFVEHVATNDLQRDQVLFTGLGGGGQVEGERLDEPAAAAQVLAVTPDVNFILDRPDEQADALATMFFREVERHAIPDRAGPIGPQALG